MRSNRTRPSGNLRRSRRQKIENLVTGHLVETGAPIKIHDISAGGFAMETPFPVRLGEVLEFRFTSKEWSSFLLRASVAHSHRIPGSVGSDVYFSGLQFAAQQTPTGQQAIKGLLEKINRIGSFPRSASA